MVKQYERWGYIDTAGKQVIPAKYDKAYHFSEGIARVCMSNKCGYIDKTGKEVIPIKFDYYYEYLLLQDFPLEKNNKHPYSFSRGLAVVKLAGKWVIINKSGSILSK